MYNSLLVTWESDRWWRIQHPLPGQNVGKVWRQGWCVYNDMKRLIGLIEHRTPILLQWRSNLWRRTFTDLWLAEKKSGNILLLWYAANGSSATVSDHNVSYKNREGKSHAGTSLIRTYRALYKNKHKNTFTEYFNPTVWNDPQCRYNISVIARSLFHYNGCRLVVTYVAW